MRVLHLTTEFPPVSYGGLGTAVGGWAQASSREGMSVGVLLIEGELVVDDRGHAARYGAAHAPGGRTSFGEQGEREVVDRERIAFFQTRWPHAVEAGVRLPREWDPDIVHLHTAMVWPVAEAIQSRMGKPPVYHVHSVDPAEYELGEEPFPCLIHSGQETAIASADRLIALSRDQLDPLTRNYQKARD